MVAFQYFSMNIAGVQPLSLIDYPEKPCSIIFTQGCVFRCAYCHNPDLIPLECSEQKKTVAEVLSFLKERLTLVDAVCITGGEPTIQAGLEDFIGQLKELGLLVKLDTNGIRPDIVSRLIEKKQIDYLAMDLKHRWEAYGEVIKVPHEALAARCKETFLTVQSSGIPHEFRTTILPGVHTEEDFFALVGYLQAGERYYIQQTSFKKTLDSSIEHEIGFDVSLLVEKLQRAFPDREIQLR